MQPSAAPISIVLLTYNEEINIRHALDSIAWSDDVVVVDSFSTDQTESICRAYPNVRFVQHPFHDLASQRQFAFDAGLPMHEWVLALDADEIVPVELAEELSQVVESYKPGAPVAYDVAMRYYMWDKWLKYSSEYPVYWRRFFRADAVKYVQAGHADKVEVNGPVGRTKHDLIHHDRHDLTHWIAKHNRYSSQEAEFALNELARTPYSDLLASDRASRRKALKRLFRSLPCNDVLRFFYLYAWRWGFLDGRAGWRYCRLKAQQAYHVALKMDELRHQSHSGASLQHVERQRSAASKPSGLRSESSDIAS